MPELNEIPFTCTHRPKDIQIYRNFPVGRNEINLRFNNAGPVPIYIYRRAIISDGASTPVAEASVAALNHDPLESYYTLLPGESMAAWLLLDAKNLARLADGQEYTAMIQYSQSEDFAWSDKILDNLDVFMDWDAHGGMTLVDEIAALLPVEKVEVPFRVRPMLKGSLYDLCLDFGASFSTCALSINPAKARQLANVKTNDEPRSIYYTRFPGAPASESGKIVPSVMMLKKGASREEPEWLFGFEAVEHAKRHPEQGVLVQDLKDKLLNLDEETRLPDFGGQKYSFSHEQIVTAYLKFLVETSKRYFGVDFNKIHITMPVGYPDRQRRAYEHILRNLGFNSIKNKLDEARAPLYHFLANKVELAWNDIKDPNARKGKTGPSSYLIIDCGGGSTDATLLRAIELSLGDNPGEGVTMKTEEPRKGGNPNFGGHDLTKLLFDYLKMRLALLFLPQAFRDLDPALQKNNEFLIDTLIETQEKDIFWELYRVEMQPELAGDNANIPIEQERRAYSLFRKIAERVEEIFPTNADKSTELSSDVWDKIQRNHNIVWQLAELLKVNIYATDSPKIINLLNLHDSPDAVFWLRQSPDSELEAFNAGDYKDALNFQTYELNKLFRPVIFKEISRILRELNVQADLSDRNSFFSVRFVGQSTNIPIFNEALAFFVPRALIEEENRTYEEKGTSRFQPIRPEEKKICCVTGAANFLTHVASGYLKNEQFVASTRVLKNFCRFGFNGKPIALGVYDSRGNQSATLIARNSPLTEARGAVMRDLSDEMEEFFGTTYDEEIRQEGFLNFTRDDMSHALAGEELESIRERWGDLFDNINSKDKAASRVLIDVAQIEDGAAQRYEFRPYYYNSERGEYCTTPEPLTMNFIRV